MSKRPEFTIVQVTEQFDVSRSTVRRGLNDGRFPNAKKDHHGRWIIPVDDVLQAGITPRKTWLKNTAHEPGSEENNEPGQIAQNSLDNSDQAGFMNQAHLEKELAHERAQVEKFKALLDAERAHVESLRMALRMIEPSKNNATEEATASEEVPATPKPPQQPARKSGLFKRLFRPH